MHGGKRPGGQAKKGTMKKLLKLLLEGNKLKLFLILVGVVINVLGNLASSIFVERITSCITTKNLNGIYTNLAILGGIYLVAVFGTLYWNRAISILTQKFMNKLRKQMFDHMETLPIKYFDTHPHGEIMSLYTNDIDTIRQFIYEAIPSIVMSVIAIVSCLVTMLCYSIWLTFNVLAGAAVMIIIIMTIGKKSSSYFVSMQQAVGKVEGNIEETMKGLKVVKVFSHEDKTLQEFDVLNEIHCQNATKANINGNIIGPILMNIGNFIYVLTTILGCVLIITGATNVSLTGVTKITLENFIPTILAFLLMSRMFSNQMFQFANNIIFVVQGMAGASRCFDLLEEKSEEDDGYVTLVNIEYKKDGSFEVVDHKTGCYAWKHPHKAEGTVTYVELKGDIVFDHVDFGYTEDKLVLQDVSIYARPGQKIALVGATGAGKTTITNLLNRFYSIADGKIRYDGININKIKKDDLRRSLAIVLQDTSLFTGTVMENIRYGRLDATDEECIEASKIANAYDFITRLPNGFNTMLSGDGANLSQGQRQLLSIARAAVMNAPVMILDEATSSIDTRTEKLVQQGTDKLMEGKTVFVVAHRLSTVKNSNAIMVMDHGRIIERGTHEDLINLKGVYYQLYTGAFELE